MTCKDCLHHEVCTRFCRGIDMDSAVQDIAVDLLCPDFTGKSKFVELRTGEWIKNDERMGWHCSCCGKDNVYAYLTYDGEVGNLQDYFCPNCGADMRGDTE